VLTEARRALAQLEAAQAAAAGSATGAAGADQGRLDLGAPGGGSDPADTPIATDPHTEAILSALRNIDPDTLSPREALGKVYDLKKLLR